MFRQFSANSLEFGLILLLMIDIGELVLMFVLISLGRLIFLILNFATATN